MVLAPLTALAMANTYVQRGGDTGWQGKAEVARDKLHGVNGARLCMAAIGKLIYLWHVNN